MSFCPIGEGQQTAWRVTLTLRRRYTEWTADRKEGEVLPIPYLRWKDDGARDAYRFICSIWKIPMEA